MEDDAKQTRAILRATAAKANAMEWDMPDLKPWRALQRWLQMGQHQVMVPYAEWLAAGPEESGSSPLSHVRRRSRFVS